MKKKSIKWHHLPPQSFGENVIRLKAYLIYQRDKCDDSIRNWYLAINELTLEYNG